jgi:hypothetical protein
MLMTLQQPKTKLKGKRVMETAADRWLAESESAVVAATADLLLNCGYAAAASATAAGTCGKALLVAGAAAGLGAAEEVAAAAAAAAA